MERGLLADGRDLNPVLAQLARAADIETGYVDPWGRHVSVPETTVRALLGALDLPAADDATAARTLANLQNNPPLLPAVSVARAGAPLRVVLGGVLGGRGQWRLHLEDGSVREGGFATADLPRSAQGAVLIPGVLPLGYHRIEVRCGRRNASAAVIVAPARCYLPPALALGERTWGFTAQLYGLRGAADTGMGDFTALAELTQASARLGAGIVGINPLHALFPDRPGQASPYAPSSRTYLNALYVDARAVPEYAASAPARQLFDAAQADGTLDRLCAAAHVDYAGVARLRLAAFEHLFDAFEATELAAGSPRAAAFQAFVDQGGAALLGFATFEALREQHAAAGTPDWRDWPSEHRDARSPAVAAFATRHARRVSFHQYLQWLADGQLADAAQCARAAAMPVGLYRDLAMGVDRAGAQAWAAPELYAPGFGTGAPPDAWNLNGQCWGFPPPLPGRSRALGHLPFAAELRANMRHAGALRIDHVLGLARLFWVPDGAPATQGGYVRYPLDELLAVLALESHRAHCMVVGEDLGTVPDGLRETLASEAVLSTRLFYFEPDAGGDFAAPEHYPALSAVGISTHDLPPLAGWLSGYDQYLKRTLGLYPTPQLEAQDEADREADLARISALAGVAAHAPAAEVARAVYAHLAATPALLTVVQPEDVLGVQEPVNVPGTSTEHANWTLRLPASIAQIAQAAEPIAQAIAAQRPPPAASTIPAVPRATYRLQLHAGFGFYDAAREVPYLAALGVSHLYTSPITRARAGSTHGYDVADFGSLNPELGGDAGFAALMAAARRHGLGIIADHVPNHMGVGQADNPWWLDVLEWGRASPHAPVFDIDWDPAKPELHGRVLLPFLGDHYGAVLESGALQLRLDPHEGSISLWYGPHRFPLHPASYRPLLQRAAALARRAGDDALTRQFHVLAGSARAVASTDPQRARAAGTALKAALADMCTPDSGAAALLAQALGAYASPDDAGRARLHRLIEQQHYRPAFWRVAADEINYRRFFQINELAGIRQEHPPVFEATHARMLELLRSGTIQGLRIDHVDGLYDPAGYLDQLTRAAGPGIEGRPWLWVEKILAAHEALPPSWPVAGTTGYELIAQLTGVQVDTAGLAAITRLYRRYTADPRTFADIARACRREVMEEELGGELAVLASLADRLAEQNPATRDYTRAAMLRALTEIVAGFPVYRTYVTAAGATDTDRQHLDWAGGLARRNRRLAETGILAFLRAALAAELPDQGARGWPRELTVQLAMKFQQYTAPVAAKAVEDTAFYRHVPLLAMNEVGAEPAHGALAPDAFHRAVAARGQTHPHALSPVTTHDTKRSADVRARLAVLAEDPRGWARCLSRLTRMAGPARRAAGPHVTRHDEWYLYQTVVGTWPGAPDAVDWEGYLARLLAHVVKAGRESGERTSWASPDVAYEGALERYIRRALDPHL
ncbi:MAG TPA: malto-oligosyltrehalose synthase, partial [Immundisolibacter sp.]|nr:malto-oligosyltrehalose synthase [Immundisolibacter sp.]